MLRFILRRVLLMIPTLAAVSIISFAIIQLPPGDFLTSYVASLEAGERVSESEIQRMREAYGLDQPMPVQYLRWVGNLLRGDFGRSLQWSKPVATIIAERLPYSFLISFSSLLIIWTVGLAIGILAAVKQYSLVDYVATFFGFIGLAVPNFLIALVLLFLVFQATGSAAVGLFSPEYQMAPWSIGKVIDLIKHLMVPAVIVGLSGTASLIKTVRANLLDELNKPYVMVARSKGLKFRTVLFRYPLRIALNPAISTLGWVLPRLVAGELLVSLVLGLPTIAPVFVESLLTQDMFVGGTIVMILSFLTIVGTLLSDILLAATDPRIRQNL